MCKHVDKPEGCKHGEKCRYQHPKVVNPEAPVDNTDLLRDHPVLSEHRESIDEDDIEILNEAVAV